MRIQLALATTTALALALSACGGASDTEDADTAAATAGEVVTHLNDVLTEEDRESMFVTLFFAILDLGSGEVEYASAGHDEVFLLHEGQQVRPELRLGRGGSQNHGANDSTFRNKLKHHACSFCVFWVVFLGLLL